MLVPGTYKQQIYLDFVELFGRSIKKLGNILLIDTKKRWPEFWSKACLIRAIQNFIEGRLLDSNEDVNILCMRHSPKQRPQFLPSRP